MRTHAASNTTCALVRSLPAVSGAVLDISSARSCTQKNRAPIRAEKTYQIQPRITYVDRAVIREYFHRHNLDKPVRPAWMNALFLKTHRQLLPKELECRLSVSFPGHERILVGNDVLLVETATREIVDVMRNVRTAGEPERHAASNWPMTRGRAANAKRNGGASFLASLRHFARGVDVDWYLVAVVAVATFALSMDVMFPPLRIAIGEGVDIYAGHARVPLSISESVHVDFLVLAIEIAVIAAAAMVGWRLGAHPGDKHG